MQWILDHLETVVAVVAFLVAGWKAKKAGSLNGFLVQRIENLAEPADKEAIRAQAVTAGVHGLLGKVVANAGLSSKEKPAGFAGKLLQTILPLFLVALFLPGCALFSTDQPSYLSCKKGMLEVTGGPVAFRVNGEDLIYRRGIITDSEAAATFEGKTSQGKRAEEAPVPKDAPKIPEAPPAPEAPK